MGRGRYEHLYRCSAGCGYEYRSPLKVKFVQCPNQAHYPRLASKAVEATFVETIDRKVENERSSE